MKQILNLALFFAIFCFAANADSIAVVFDSVQLTGAPGDTLTFSGSLTNNDTSTDYINGVGLNLAGFDVTDYDDSDFLFDAPISLDPTVDSGSFDFFTVTIPAGFAPGIYVGTLNVDGGTDPSDGLVIGSADFSVNVESSVPEPASFALVVLGGTSLLGVRMRRNGRNRT